MLKKNINICLLNYGAGNINSVYNAFKFLGYKIKISNNEIDLCSASHLVLPGVGAFDNSMSKVNKNLPLKTLRNLVLDKNKPFLGICVGMQILASFGYEFKKTKGLQFIDGEVIKIKAAKLKLPHIGWNKILSKKKINILSELDDKDFYFVHSYFFKCKNNNNIAAITKYKSYFPSVINKNNIYGVQFHPEKSQINGLRLLDNFIKYN